MDAETLKRFARQLLDGQMSIDQFAETAAAAQPRSAELPEATIDLDRRRRCGFPEVVFGEGKSAETLIEIVNTLREADQAVLATRVAQEKANLLLAKFPAAIYNAIGRTFRLHNAAETAPAAPVGLVTAGSSDFPVAEEARETLLWMGVEPTVVTDVGVAGPHRFVEKAPLLEDAAAVVVVAGMEGALPSVVGGHVACPVIAVPTSVGYGASFGGVAALLGMLNSCAANVTVVNIDAGFKAGYLAGMIARQTAI